MNKLGALLTCFYLSSAARTVLRAKAAAFLKAFIELVLCVLPRDFIAFTLVSMGEIYTGC